MAGNHTIAENLKKYFYSGVGYASHASELFQKTMSESVKAGRVSESDGKKIIDDVLKGGSKNTYIFRDTFYCLNF